MVTTLEAKRRVNAAVSVLDNPALTPVLQKVHLADADGNLRQTNLNIEGLGMGPILDPAVIERFGQLDTTRNLAHLAWMLEQAGGGAEARRDSEEKFQMCRSLFIQERMEGQGEAGTEIKPMTREEATAAWAAEEPVFRNAFFPADEDMLVQNNGTVFGYARHWPGLNNRYEQVYEAVKVFLDNINGRIGNQSKVSVINQARQQRGISLVPVEMDLTKYASVEDLKRVNDEFFYFFKRKTASKDIQFVGKHPEKPEYSRGSGEKFYEDAYIVAYVPVTAAAMMKVGFDNWCVANKTEFERAFSADERYRAVPRWTGYTQSGPFMVIHPKVDLRDWDVSMKRIAVYMPRDLCDIPNLVEPYEGVQFFDKTNRNAPRPVDWPELKGRFLNADQIGDQGEAVASSIKAALDHFIAWARQMRDDEIKSSVYERLAAVLVYEMLYS